MDDLNIVAVRIKHPGRIIARIVFETSLRRFLTLSSSCLSGLVECIYFEMVFRYKSHVNGLRVWLSFFEPEKALLPSPKPVTLVYCSWKGDKEGEASPVQQDIPVMAIRDLAHSHSLATPVRCRALN